MQSMPTADQEAKEDLFYGQIVIIVARWFLIAVGLTIAVWGAGSAGDLAAPVAFIVILMAVNFFIHGRYLMGQPLNATLVYVSVAVDFVVILGIVLIGTESLGKGLANPFFVFLYAELLALGLVFQQKSSLIFAAIALAAYVGVSILVSQPSPITDFETTKDLLRRLVTLATTAGLGTYYWRIQRGRRRDIASSRASLLAGAEQLTAQPSGRS